MILCRAIFPEFFHPVKVLVDGPEVDLLIRDWLRQEKQYLTCKFVACE